MWCRCYSTKSRNNDARTKYLIAEIFEHPHQKVRHTSWIAVTHILMRTKKAKRKPQYPKKISVADFIISFHASYSPHSPIPQSNVPLCRFSTQVNPRRYFHYFLILTTQLQNARLSEDLTRHFPTRRPATSHSAAVCETGDRSRESSAIKKKGKPQARGFSRSSSSCGAF